MRNEAGDIMEDISGAEPFSYVHGSGNLMPALEAEMTGMSAGQAKSFAIQDKILRGAFHFEVFVDNVRPATITEIESGIPSSKVTEADCGPDCIC